MRLISVLPSATEFVHALGCSSLLVGVSDHCDYPFEPLQVLPRLGDFLHPRIEEILALSPDLVLLDRRYQRRLAERLPEAGVNGLESACDDFGDVFRFVEDLGQILGVADRADDLRRWFCDGLDRWKAWSEGLASAKPSVLRLLAALPDGRGIVAGGDTLQGKALELAGGRNAAASLAGYAVIEGDWPGLRKLDALVLCTFGGSGRTLADEGGLVGRWEDLPVVRDRAFISVPCSLMCRCTHRWFDLLEALACQVHRSRPDLSPWRC